MNTVTDFFILLLAILGLGMVAMVAMLAARWIGHIGHVVVRAPRPKSFGYILPRDYHQSHGEIL